MPAVKVKKNEAEKIKKLLKKEEIYDGKRRPQRVKNYILFPVTDLKKAQALGFEVVDVELPMRPELSLIHI